MPLPRLERVHEGARAERAHLLRVRARARDRDRVRVRVRVRVRARARARARVSLVHERAHRVPEAQPEVARRRADELRGVAERRRHLV